MDALVNEKFQILVLHFLSLNFAVSPFNIFLQKGSSVSFSITLNVTEVFPSLIFSIVLKFSASPSDQIEKLSYIFEILELMLFN